MSRYLRWRLDPLGRWIPDLGWDDDVTQAEWMELERFVRRDPAEKRQRLMLELVRDAMEENR